MPSTQTDHLFKLIKALSKSEKRSFKLYANRISGSETALFVQLFDVLDKQNEYEEETIFQRVPGIKRSQLSNLKRHLYKQLLTSLRLIHIDKHPDIEIREQIDHARILYSKGLYMQSLKVLDRTKKVAMDAHQDLLHLEINEFEKMIESRHITRSIENRANELSDENRRRSKVVRRAGKLSNLALKLYGLYIKIGHIRNEDDVTLVEEFFRANFPEDINYDELTFYERIHYNQCYVWYYYILQNFPQHYRATERWLEVFDQFPHMKTLDPDLYLRGLNNQLGGLFFMGYYSRHEQIVDTLETFYQQNRTKFNTNTAVLAFLTRYTAKLNNHFMEGTFTQGLELVPDLKRQLKKHHLHLDQHHTLSFYYKIACLYFGSGDPDTAVDWLNKIINMRAGNLRADIQCYARILHLICHYELGNNYLLEYLVKSVYRFLAKMDSLDQVQQEILRFLRRELYTDPKSLGKAFRKLRAKLLKLKEDPFQRRSFLYLDIEAWLESKIEGKKVERVIAGNFEGMR